jgi:hypothetical protein
MPRIPSIAAIALALAFAGCKSGSSAPVVSTDVTPTRLQTPNAVYNITVGEDKNVMVASILAPIDSVWRALPGVFLELQVDPTTIDPKEHVISNTGFVVRRSMGGARLSRYLDCGGNISGAFADQLKITMSLTVQVVADSADVSTLRTQMTAYGTQEAVTGNSVICATTGALESRIAHMVNEELKARAKK